MRIPENDNDEDIQCDVCLEFEYEDDDMIVICEMCNAAVHQCCYGGLEVPKGDWFCDRCTELKRDTNVKCNDIKCFLCNEVQGIIKKIEVAD